MNTIFMVLNVSEISKVSEKHPLIKELGELVNKRYNSGIDGILEVTYGYQDLGNGKRYNTSLFQEYAGIKFSNNINFGELKNIFITKAQGDIKKFQDLINKVSNTDDADLSEYRIGENEKRVLIQAIQHNIYLLELAINGIDFELEKAGHAHGLSDEEIRIKIIENERLEKEVFGGNILDNQKESEYAFQYIRRGFQEYLAKSQKDKQKRVNEKQASKVLDKEEEKRLEGYISRLKEVLTQRNYSTDLQEKKATENSTRKFFKEFSHVKIPRETIRRFFQDTIDLQGMRQSVEITDKKSVFDGSESLEIPNSDNFENLSFERVCGLLVHEISAHYVNQANHEAGTFGDARLTGNVEKEEGLAMFSEKMLKGLPVTGEDAVNPSFVMVMAAEVFSGEELKDFIDLYMNISERKSSPEANMNRRKRNYPDDYVGVQHKDVTYVRGLIRIVEFLGVDGGNGQGNIEDLFVGKVGIDSIIAGDFSFDKEKMLFPILNTEVMLFYIMNALDKDPGGKFKHEDFMKYMKNKYKGIVSEASMEKLKNTQLSRKNFHEMLVTISPIIAEFANQYAANDNEEVPGHVEEMAQRLGSIVQKHNS